MSKHRIKHVNIQNVEHLEHTPPALRQPERFAVHMVSGAILDVVEELFTKIQRQLDRKISDESDLVNIVDIDVLKKQAKCSHFITHKIVDKDVCEDCGYVYQ